MKKPNLLKSLLFLFLFSLLFIINAYPQVDNGKLIKDVYALSADSMEGRATGTNGNEKALQYIIGRLLELQAKPFSKEFIQKFAYETKREKGTGKNILATIRGRTNDYFVISAHFDHVGIKNNEIYNGADDNASGVASLLAMIEYFSKNTPEHSLVFAFFDGEELGLKGSKAFVQSLEEKVTLNINLDMVSRNDKNEIYAAGISQNAFLKPFVEKAATDFKNITVLFGHDVPGSGGNDWSNSSDHGPFKNAGIPYLYFGVEDHPDYHKPTDDPDKIDPVFFSSVVNMIIKVTEELDTGIE